MTARWALGCVTCFCPVYSLYMHIFRALTVTNISKLQVGFAIDSKLKEYLNEFLIEVYEDGTIQEIAEKYGIQTVSKLPINPKIASAADKGMLELFEGDWLDNMIDMIEKLEK